MDEPQAVEVAFPIPEDRLFTYLSHRRLEVGVRVLARLKNRKVKGIVVNTEARPPEGIELKPVERALDEEPLTGPYTLKLGYWIAQQTLCSLGEALSAMLPSAMREKELPLLEDSQEFHRIENLSEEQTQAVRMIVESPTGWFYLQGPTGSGKTEVYLQAARHVIDTGKRVLYLVPEISLTFQLIDQTRKRFKRVAVLHSALSPSQRLREWERIRKGEVDLVLGARSAVFAPMDNIGLIVVDEEQEMSYKSQAVPRYHARSVAMILSKWQGARLVMGSATPSLEALHAIEEGLFVRLRLSRRLAGGAQPQVHLLDTRQLNEIFSPELAQAILDTHTEGLQSVIVLNRRGYTNLYHCRHCHYEMQCPHCSVPVTYHKSRDLVICHHCGYSGKSPPKCPNCGSSEVGWAGYGTELVEQELRRLFPQLRLARLDSDTVADRKQAAGIIKGFAGGDIDLLVGTQMIAKGLNFPRLKTVGILNADIGLSIPDFRSAERVYSLIRQTAGRAGRYRPDGQVYIQTYRPDYWVMQAAAQAKDEEFQKRELELRKTTRLPPYTRLLRVVLRHRDVGKVKADAAALSLFFERSKTGSLEIIGPAPCPLEKLNDWYRYHALVCGPHVHELREIGHRMRSWKSPSRSVVELDMDPYHLR